MIHFLHKISDPNGLHARNAARLSNFVRSCGCAVRVSYKKGAADASQVMELMKLYAKYGDELEFRVEGELEEETTQRLKAFLAEIL